MIYVVLRPVFGRIMLLIVDLWANACVSVVAEEYVHFYYLKVWVLQIPRSVFLLSILEFVG